VLIDEDPIEWIKQEKIEYDVCLPLAPEEGMILYKITKSLEDKELMVAGSSSNAVMLCSDKWKTYNALKDKISFAPTEKIFFDQIEDKVPEFNKKMVVKPVDGVSCANVQIVSSPESYIAAAREIKKNSSLPFFLLQEYLEGLCTSVSLLCDGNESIPISLNLQKIKVNNSHMEYNGGQVPLKHPLAKAAYEAAQTAVESIKGIRGYVGVDMILGDTIQLLEINSRPTTSYIALHKLLNFNLGHAIINACQGTLPKKVLLRGTAQFKKDGNKMNLTVI
jgi:predicted ATP-grasp superfamily ATP-dependent carboligase